MDDLFQLNAAPLADRWPALLQRLMECSHDELQVTLVEGLSSTLLVNGVQLTSRHDRLKEAHLQADTLAADSPAIHLYGTGLGDLQQLLLTRPALKQLEIKILNLSLFSLVLHVSDQRSWLSDPRVTLSVAGDDDYFQRPFFALPAELHLADDYNARVRDHLVAELEQSYVNRQFDPHDPERVRRLDSNLPLLKVDHDVEELFSREAKHEAYVIATGPTLEQHYDHLRQVRQATASPLLICVDTAFRPLMEQGIRPDMVVSIDHLITDAHLPSDGSAGIPLVYFPMVDNRVLTSWQGPRYAAYSTSPTYDRLRSVIKKGSLYCGGSVIHPAIDLAVRMGFTNISLFGADFSFPGEKSHASWGDGALGPTVNTAKHWVLNGHGERIKTLRNFRSYLCNLERYIAKHPAVTFLNTSRDGARIGGTAYHPELTR